MTIDSLELEAKHEEVLGLVGKFLGCSIVRQEILPVTCTDLIYLGI